VLLNTYMGTKGMARMDWLLEIFWVKASQQLWG
jgi:hypothetical protein